MAKQVDAPDLKSVGENRAGSSPAVGTLGNIQQLLVDALYEKHCPGKARPERCLGRLKFHQLGASFVCFVCGIETKIKYRRPAK